MKNTMRSRLLALTYKDVTQTGVLTAFRWSLGTPSCRRRSHATRHIRILEASTGLPPLQRTAFGNRLRSPHARRPQNRGGH